MVGLAAHIKRCSDIDLGLIKTPLKPSMFYNLHGTITSRFSPYKENESAKSNKNSTVTACTKTWPHGTPGYYYTKGKLNSIADMKLVDLYKAKSFLLLAGTSEANEKIVEINDKI